MLIRKATFFFSYLTVVGEFSRGVIGELASKFDGDLYLYLWSRDETKPLVVLSMAWEIRENPVSSAYFLQYI